MLGWIENRRSDARVKCRVFFNRKCIHVDSVNGRVVTEDLKGALHKEVYDLVVGCDGARSVARYAVMQQPNVYSESYGLPNFLWKLVSFEGLETWRGQRAIWTIDSCSGGVWHMPSGKVKHLYLSIL